MESVLRQREPDFELLVIDDGSTDDSLAYLYSVHDTRVRVISQTRRGLTATLNRMLREANTPWLMRHDADDIAYPQRVRRTLEYIDRYPEAGMFYSLADYYSAGRRFGRFRTTQGTPDALRQITQAGYLLAICHPAVTLNVQRAVAAGGYRFDLYVEDVDLWWRMALMHDIQFIPEVTVGVRHNFASSSAQRLRSQVLNALYVQYLLISHLTGREPLPYDSVKGILGGLVNVPTLRFREEMRFANASVAAGDYWPAIGHVARAFVVSPKAFIARTFYELHPNMTTRQGEKPEILANMSGLWEQPKTPAGSEPVRGGALLRYD
jgi:hypothetical protein